MSLHDIFVKAFGVPQEELLRLQDAKSKEEMEEVLDHLKRLTKVIWKKRAMELHPDRGGDLEEMKKLNALWNTVKGLKVKATPPPVMRVPVTFVLVNFYGSATTTQYTPTGGFSFYPGGTTTW